MDKERLLPFLAVACCDALGVEKGKLPPPYVRSEIAARAKTGEATVKRFLRGENTPRGADLDAMVAAVAHQAGISWLEPWQVAVGLALVHEAEQAAKNLPPGKELLRILQGATQQVTAIARNTGASTPESGNR